MRIDVAELVCMVLGLAIYTGMIFALLLSI